jgi:hypothetical protein
MLINGFENISPQFLSEEVKRGAKFVVFEYCFSVLIVTIRRSSSVYFIGAGESAIPKSLYYTFLSLVLGWWGIPWGPIYTIDSIVTNFRGGREVTLEVMSGFDIKA